MKQFYLLILLLFSFNLSFAQDNSLLGHWSLDSIFDVDILLENPENPIFIEFTETSNEIIITDFCGESYTSLYTSSTMENAFNILESDPMPSACSDDVQGFQNVTYILFGNTTTEPKEITYTITQTDDVVTLMLYYELFVSEGVPQGISASFTKISSPPNPDLIGNWYLDFISTNNVIHNNYFNETQDMGIEFKTTIVDGQNNLDYVGTSSCNFFAGGYTADESTIVLGSMEITLVDCQGTALNVYEEAYLSVLGGNTSLPNNLTYTITGTIDEAQLTLFNQETGDFAVFGKTAPSTILVKTWYLTQIEIPGNSIINVPIGDTPTLILTNDIHPIFFKAEANGNNDCNSYNCLYNLSLVNGNNIQIQNFEETLVDCVSSNYALEYTLTLWNSSTSFFDYEISTDGSTLTLTDLLGVTLIYGDVSLSMNENVFKASKITLTKNPVTNSLDISTTQNLIGSSYEIFSITGQRIMNGTLNFNSINVNQLQSGLYFLKVSTHQNVFETVKFIKD